MVKDCSKPASPPASGANLLLSQGQPGDTNATASASAAAEQHLAAHFEGVDEYGFQGSLCVEQGGHSQAVEPSVSAAEGGASEGDTGQTAAGQRGSGVRGIRCSLNLSFFLD